MLQLEIEPPRQIDDVLYQTVQIPHRGETLHLQRVYQRVDGPTVFMLHGSLGNGRVFYSKTGKGLACHLARCGYDTFVGDLRGRGQSRPAIGPGSSYGQTESIVDEIPLFHDALEVLRPGAPLYWNAHSWGGTLLVSFLARFPERLPRLKAAAFFGSKRVIHRDTFLKRFLLTPVWDYAARAAVGLRGYLSGRWLRFSDDCETRKSYLQTAAWLRGEPWVDSDDGFDYQAVVEKGLSLPPILHLGGAADTVLGAASDIDKFRRQLRDPRGRLVVVGKAGGHHRDYGHLDILIHPDGPEDQFRLVTDWFARWR